MTFLDQNATMKMLLWAKGLSWYNSTLIKIWSTNECTLRIEEKCLQVKPYSKREERVDWERYRLHGKLRYRKMLWKIIVLWPVASVCVKKESLQLELEVHWMYQSRAIVCRAFYILCLFTSTRRPHWVCYKKKVDMSVTFWW